MHAFKNLNNLHTDLSESLSESMHFLQLNYVLLKSQRGGSGLGGRGWRERGAPKAHRNCLNF